MSRKPRTSGLKGPVPCETDYKIELNAKWSKTIRRRNLQASDKNTQNGHVDSNQEPK